MGIRKGKSPIQTKRLIVCVALYYPEFLSFDPRAITKPLIQKSYIHAKKLKFSRWSKSFSFTQNTK